MRKKPSRPVHLSYEDGYLAFSSNGTIKIEGNIKNAALALFKHILNKNGTITWVGYIKIICIPGKPYTLEWGSAGSKPEHWDEFKKEYERICELKIFS